MSEKSENPYDMDSASFDADKYLQKLLKTCNLKQIMDTEAMIVKETQTLHSEMQTLVYENYNKFISATETIRQMKTDFKEMENEMKKLADNMAEITQSSDQITGTLHDTRCQLTKLSEKNALLKRLSAISSLPGKLTQLVADKNYVQAVQEYNRAQRILQQYGNQPTFKGIQEDCSKIMSDLKTILKQDFQKEGKKTAQLTETGELLLQLNEKPSDLSKEMLQFGSQRLHEQLIQLQDQTDRDMIEFVDMGIEGFLSDLILITTSFYDMFVQKHFENEDDSFQELARGNLNDFVNKYLNEYLNLVQERVENETGDSQILLRALDRLHRRLCAMKNLGRGIDMPKTGIDLIIHSIHQLCQSHYKILKDSFSDSLSSIRLTLVTFKNDGMCGSLNELIDTLYVNTIEKVKGVLQDLLVFLNPEWSFNIKAEHKGVACIEGIRENLLVSFLRHIASVMTSFSDINSSCPANLLLVLSKVCLRLEKVGVQSLLNLVDELYEIDSVNSAELTHETELNSELHDSAQILLEAYVRVQGMNVSQILRKSVETRDWINCLEPRSVRAVMKRIVDELTNIDGTLDELFESGVRTTASSDSSRKTHLSMSMQGGKTQYRSTWSNYTSSSQLDTNLVHRLFSERLDIFSSAIEFSKTSILSGIIKISLKTFLECVRLKTFSKYGLQQIQVDAHYLQMNLWRFVSDENVIHYLLDDILGSAVIRCQEKAGMLMEPNAVEIICERF
ncbi:CLUMA_CG018027, isoform A [Clunio marinus]|uniref:Vacuolar protein sorting-associated protein 51 homolog n=1 Tax=Clunio marinus TaxID=568069 RepID=A0A1J1J2L3_9DIPT|nr:CLUMA_CG018027, isoform A [Clunio marinus]